MAACPRLWRQFIDGVTHCVLNDRYTAATPAAGGQGGGPVFQRRVPQAFEVFHLEIEGQDDVARAVDRVATFADNGIQIGIFVPNAVAGGAHTLLEVWSVSREALGKGKKVRRARDGLTALRVLMRSIFSRLHLLPLGLQGRGKHQRAAAKKARGFFVAPLGAYDHSTGLVNAKHAFTGQGVEFKDPVRFENLTESVQFPMIPLEENGSGERIPSGFRVSVVHAVCAPEVCEIGGAGDTSNSVPQYAIIGDYVNRGGPQAAEWVPPFSRQRAGTQTGCPPPALSTSAPQTTAGGGGGAVAAARPDSTGRYSDGASSGGLGNDSLNAALYHHTPNPRTKSPGNQPLVLQNRSFQTHTASIPIKTDTPPPFALTPTISSLHSNGSWNHTHGAVLMQQHLHGVARGAGGVSPPEHQAHWAPRFDTTAAGTWAPKAITDGGVTGSRLETTRDVVARDGAAAVHHDISPFMAFFEEDELDILDGNDGTGSDLHKTLHSDDEVSKFRDKMEAVTLSDGFPPCDTLRTSTSPYAASSLMMRQPSALPPVARNLADVRQHLEELRAGFESISAEMDEA